MAAGWFPEIGRGGAALQPQCAEEVACVVEARAGGDFREREVGRLEKAHGAVGLEVGQVVAGRHADAVDEGAAQGAFGNSGRFGGVRDLDVPGEVGLQEVRRDLNGIGPPVGIRCARNGARKQGQERDEEPGDHDVRHRFPAVVFALHLAQDLADAPGGLALGAGDDRRGLRVAAVDGLDQSAGGKLRRRKRDVAVEQDVVVGDVLRRIGVAVPLAGMDDEEIAGMEPFGAAFVEMGDGSGVHIDELGELVVVHLDDRVLVAPRVQDGDRRLPLREEVLLVQRLEVLDSLVDVHGLRTDYSKSTGRRRRPLTVLAVQGYNLRPCSLLKRRLARLPWRSRRTAMWC